VPEASNVKLQLSYSSGGVPMISVDDAEEIAELCMLAGRPDRIAEFLGSRLTPGEVKNRLSEAAAPPTPARGASSKVPGSTSAAANGSIFGGPTAAEQDALTVAVRQRLAAMSAKS
jgi:hypothetical protein